MVTDLVCPFGSRNGRGIRTDHASAFHLSFCLSLLWCVSLCLYFNWTLHLLSCFAILTPAVDVSVCLLFLYFEGWVVGGLVFMSLFLSYLLLSLYLLELDFALISSSRGTRDVAYRD
ncbi:hypothetical protein K457DRAFT_582926 [Linnemannia elongata AG-77]|uniref:Uncharacterized protein n=1 Tax=Linnemannia elongata AG-77 TaxID=1314771 RepID=A0A197KDL5_9FUNG|nr:hypothetical protein K457DRAFT_582926 [Linnemannia elongata AG-77]